MGCGASSRGMRPFYEAFELQDVIGNGKYGEVYASVERASRENFAVRVIKPHESEFSLKDLWKEGTLWRSLGPCTYIVQWFTIRKEGDTVFVLMEKCSFTLIDKLQMPAGFSPQKISKYFTMMLRAISWVHSAKIVHGNIKASNFLCAGEGDNTIKLTDFREAKALPQKGMLKGELGSASYMSPEMLMGTGYGLKTDVWSFGVMSYALLFGEFPYGANEKSSSMIKETIISQRTEPRFVHVPSGERSGDFLGPAARFCRVLLRRSQDMRCSANEALSLCFIGGQDSVLELENKVTAMRPPTSSGTMFQSILYTSHDSERSLFSQRLQNKELCQVPIAKSEMEPNLANAVA
mmetsp:Transcript_10481/g.16753  ORF Transcript_10481/g.16753 Transcript_10481/m.16753 type:complete len:350 (-) Transcript_10481:67-1116(-)